MIENIIHKKISNYSHKRGIRINFEIKSLGKKNFQAGMRSNCRCPFPAAKFGLAKWCACHAARMKTNAKRHVGRCKNGWMR